MNFDKVEKRKTRYLFLFGCIAILFGLYFRLSFVFMNGESSKNIQRRAESLVYESVKQQIKDQMEVENANLNHREKDERVEDQLLRVLTAEKEKFDETVRVIREDLEMKSESKKHAKNFLLESDPYYYYYLTKNILVDGKLSAQIKNGKFFEPLRLTPQGTWSWMTLHPHLGAYWYRFLKLFSDIDLMQALCLFPVVLFFLTVSLYYVFAGQLKISAFSIFLGSLAFVLAAIFIQRSAYGWYDTDLYNYLFPIGIFTLYGTGSRSKKFYWVFALIAGFVTASYFFFWSGWHYIFVIVVACGFLTASINWILGSGEKVRFLLWTITYVVSTIFFASMLMTPGGFQQSYFSNIWTLPKMAGRDTDVGIWPNCLFIVGELSQAPFRKIIYLCGNYISWSFAIVGFVAGGYGLWKKERSLDRSQYIMLAALTIPALLLTVRAQRFVGFLVLPFSFFVMLGVEKIRAYAEQLMGTYWEKFFNRRYLRIATCFLLLVIFLPFTLVVASAVPPDSRLIMNDTWFRALNEIKEKTPTDAIVDSWWNPGYFILSMAERRTVLDGGTLMEPHNYWMAKALLSPDENQAAGIIHMLNTIGMKAVDLLLSSGFGPSEATDLVLNLVALPADEAEDQLPNSLKREEKKKLIDLLFSPQKPTPTYLLIWNELIRNNIELSFLVNWDFKKAKAISEWEKRLKKPLRNVERMKVMNERIWKYTPEVVVKEVMGETLSFVNGFQVNLSTLESVLKQPEGDLKPISLFYLQDGELVEKEYHHDNTMDVSALLVEKEGNYTSVLADPALIRSMLFRLYYLRGQGLKLFKPFFQEDSVVTKTSVYVYEIDWDAFRRRKLSNVEVKKNKGQ